MRVVTMMSSYNWDKKLLLNVGFHAGESSNVNLFYTANSFSILYETHCARGVDIGNLSGSNTAQTVDSDVYLTRDVGQYVFFSVGPESCVRLYVAPF